MEDKKIKFSELKRCPFCGGRGKWYTHGESVYVACENGCIAFREPFKCEKEYLDKFAWGLFRIANLMESIEVAMSALATKWNQRA